MLDASRFDKHIRGYQLRAMHGVYHMLFGQGEIQKFCDFQLACKGRTTKGIKYRLGPQRKSGDMDTSLGNCLIMCGMVIGWLRRVGIAKFDLFDDGDDCLVFIERAKLAHALATLDGEFAGMGHNITLEGIANRLEEIVHCQAIYLGGSVGVMTRKWEKVLSHGLCSIRHFFSKRGGSRILKTMAFCESVLGTRVPIVWKFAEMMRRMVSGVRARAMMSDDLKILRRASLEIDINKLESVPMPSAPDYETRLAFERATGVSPARQRRIEGYLEEDVRFDLSFEFRNLRTMRYRTPASDVPPTYLDFSDTG